MRLPLFAAAFTSAAIVIDPAPLVIDIPEPAVNVDLAKVFPVVLPMRISPLVYEVCPVPPLATGSVLVTSLDRLTLLALIAEVPLPFKTPVSVAAPVPPLATARVPVTWVARLMLVATGATSCQADTL